MIDKLRLLNPFKPIIAADDAGAAARAGAVGAFLTVVSSLYGGVRLYLHRDQLLAIARQSASAPGQDPEVTRQTAAMMEGLVTYTPLVATVIMVLLYLVFGAIQWRRRTAMIPLIMFLFSAYGVVVGLLGFLNPQTQIQSEAFGISIWERGVSWIFAVIVMALFWAGFRGGNRLKKIGAAPDISTF
ncbi:hypothetical protein [Caulobacter sp. 1776]|uniref:hypothetical protein n=1 Tax=Caulobacter sp. 1776 TaxID=3156420 RepID=UPI003393B84D